MKLGGVQGKLEAGGLHEFPSGVLHLCVVISCALIFEFFLINELSFVYMADGVRGESMLSSQVVWG